MCKQKTLYALKYGEHLLCLYASSNGDDATCCGDYEAHLYIYGKNPWVTTDKEIAERITNENIPWYNSDIETPSNEYAGKCEVVEIKLGE